MKIENAARASVQTLLIAALCASLGCAANVAPEASGDSGEKSAFAGSTLSLYPENDLIAQGATFLGAAGAVTVLVGGKAVVLTVALYALPVTAVVVAAVAGWKLAELAEYGPVPGSLLIPAGARIEPHEGEWPLIFDLHATQLRMEAESLGGHARQNALSSAAVADNAMVTLHSLFDACIDGGGGFGCMWQFGTFASIMARCVDARGGTTCGTQVYLVEKKAELDAAASFELCCRQAGGGVAPTGSYGDWNACTGARHRLPPRQQSSCYCAVAGNCP